MWPFRLIENQAHRRVLERDHSPDQELGRILSQLGPDFSDVVIREGELVIDHDS